MCSQGKVQLKIDGRVSFSVICSHFNIQLNMEGRCLYVLYVVESKCYKPELMSGVQRLSSICRSVEVI